MASLALNLSQASRSLLILNTLLWFGIAGCSVLDITKTKNYRSHQSKKESASSTIGDECNVEATFGRLIDERCVTCHQGESRSPNLEVKSRNDFSPHGEEYVRILTAIKSGTMPPGSGVDGKTKALAAECLEKLFPKEKLSCDPDEIFSQVVDANCTSCHNKSIRSDILDFTDDRENSWHSILGKISEGTMPPSGPLNADIRIAAKSCLSGEPVLALCDERAEMPSKVTMIDSVYLRNSIQSIFGSNIAAAVEPELRGFANRLGKSPFSSFTEAGTSAGVSAAQYVATTISYDLLTDSRLLSLNSCLTNIEPSTNCLNSFFEKTGRLILRRPLRSQDFVQFNAVYQHGLDTKDFMAGLRMVIAYMLMSPDFLYHFENGSNDGTALESHEVLARLTRYLWHAAPDQNLINQTSSLNLSTTAGVHAAASFILADSRTEANVANLYRELFDIDSTSTVTKNPHIASNISNANDYIRDAKTEFFNFVHQVAAGGSFIDLLVSRYSKPPSVAIAETLEQPANKVGNATTLSANRQGFLTRPALLLSNESHINIPRFGKKVVTKVLCSPIEIPPPDASEEGLGGKLPETATWRERFDAIGRSPNPSCRGCHASINGPGFMAQGGFSSIGEAKVAEDVFNAAHEIIATYPLDTTGSMTVFGRKYSASSLADLSSTISTMPQYQVCAVKNFISYAEGRDLLTTQDACFTNRIANPKSITGKSIKDILRDIVTSVEFRERH